MTDTILARFTDAVRCPHGLSGWTNDDGQLIIRHGSNPEACHVFMASHSPDSDNLTDEFQQALRKTLDWACRACEYEGVRGEALTPLEEREAFYAFVIDTLTPSP